MEELIIDYNIICSTSSSTCTQKKQKCTNRFTSLPCTLQRTELTFRCSSWSSVLVVDTNCYQLPREPRLYSLEYDIHFGPQIPGVSVSLHHLCLLGPVPTMIKNGRHTACAWDRKRFVSSPFLQLQQSRVKIIDSSFTLTSSAKQTLIKTLSSLSVLVFRQNPEIKNMYVYTYKT